MTLESFDLVGDALIPAIAKGSLLVLLALIVARTLRHRVSAAWRHAIIMAAIAAYVFVVVTGISAPSLRWHVLPAIESGRVEPLLAATRTNAATRVSEAGESEAPGTSTGATTPIQRRTALTVLWCCGTLLFLGRLLVIMVVTAKLRRRTTALKTPSTQELLWQCQMQLDTERSVELRVGDDVSSPFLWGIRKPAIFFPAAVHDWQVDRIRVVLLHEVAHLQRRDVAFAFATQVIRALFWWNPVLWIALREAEEVREIAADDMALATGVEPGPYVTEIVELVRSSRRAALYPAFADGLRFERRMMHALSANKVPGRVRRRSAWLLAAAAVSGGCATATLAARQPVVASGITGCAYDGGRHLDVGRRLPDGRPVWRIEWSGASCDVRIELIGRTTFDVVAGRIVFTDATDTFRLRSVRAGASDSLVIVQGDAMDHAALVREMEQHTGFGAPVRVPALLREGGYAAVLAEARTMQVDHAVGRYLTEALTRQAPTVAELSLLLELAIVQVTNEYQMVALLNAAAPHGALQNAALQSAYGRAVETLQTTAGRQAVMASLAAHHPRGR